MGLFYLGVIMKHLIESNDLKIGGLGRLTATVKGTRKYSDDDIAIVVRDGREMRVEPNEVRKDDVCTFMGRELLDPGIIVMVRETPNVICNEGLLLAAGFFRDESAVYDVGLTYCEIGTGATEPAFGDEALTTYFFRKLMTSRTRLLYVDTFSTFFTSGESEAVIAEAGVWGGSGAIADAASGLLFAHWLSSFDNSLGAYDLTFDYILTIGRA